jgi:hypothetical protein
MNIGMTLYDQDDADSEAAAQIVDSMTLVPASAHSPSRVAGVVWESFNDNGGWSSDWRRNWRQSVADRLEEAAF